MLCYGVEKNTRVAACDSEGEAMISPTSRYVGMILDELRLGFGSPKS